MKKITTKKQLIKYILKDLHGTHHTHNFPEGIDCNPPLYQINVGGSIFVWDKDIKKNNLKKSKRMFNIKLDTLRDNIDYLLQKSTIR